MKLSFIFFSIFTSLAFADAISINSTGKQVTITQIGVNGISSEILDIASTAHKAGFKDDKGADIFVERSVNGGSHRQHSLTNKYLKTSMSSGIALTFNTVISASKKEEISLSSDKKTLTLKGKASTILMNALLIQIPYDHSQPVGSYTVKSKSKNISCSRVVHPKAIATCTITLK